MQIKVSKVFANFINEVAKENNAKFHAEVIEMSERIYLYYVGNISGSWPDYNAKTGKYKVIQISYPYEYHAATIQLSTSRLHTLYYRHNVKTVDDLKQMILDICEI